VRGFYGVNLVLSTITWRIHSIDTANDAVIIELNRTNIQGLLYSYFQVGMVYNAPEYPPEESAVTEAP
jgi:hypothetical protein